MVASNIKGPLSGVRVLDLTHVWAGPLAVRTVADLGATVVKVERPHARGPRAKPSTPVGGWLDSEHDWDHWNRNGAYIKLQRNRFGLALDYKSEPGRQVLLELVAKSDVIVENYSAGAMQAMGLGYDELSRANPQIIYVTMPGYGSTGPYSERVAFGTVIESLSALTSMMGYSEQELKNSAQALPDAMGGMHTVSAITQALTERQRTGNGARIEISLHEAGVTISGPWLVAEQLGESPQVMGNSHPAMSPHGIYACTGEDNWLALACEDDNQWRSLCDLLGFNHKQWTLPERCQNSTKIDEQISKWTALHNKNAATERLQAAGIPAGPVQNAPEMMADPQLNARGFYDWHDRFGVPLQGDPVHRNNSGVDHWLPSPFLGEHNRAVLKDWLGYDAQRLTELESAGILVDAPPE